MAWAQIGVVSWVVAVLAYYVCVVFRGPDFGVFWTLFFGGILGLSVSFMGLSEV